MDCGYIVTALLLTVGMVISFVEGVKGGRRTFPHTEAVKAFGKEYESFTVVEPILQRNQTRIGELLSRRDHIYRSLAKPGLDDHDRRVLERNANEIRSGLEFWRKKLDRDTGLAYLTGHGSSLRKAKELLLTS